MFSKICTGLFWDGYDNLGRILLVNIFWALLNLPGLAILYSYIISRTYLNIVWLSILIPFFFLFAVTTSGMFHFTYLLVEQKDISVKEFFKGMKLYWLKGTLVQIISLLVFIILFINIRFYLNLQGGLKMTGAIFAGLAFWVGLFFLMVNQYLLPLLVRQNPPLKKLFWRAILLTLDNLLMTLLVGTSALGLLILSCMTGVGPILFTTALLTLFWNNVLFEILAKYDKDPEPEPTPPGEKPTSWHQIIKKEKPKWRHEDRGWKDILRPWDT